MKKGVAEKTVLSTSSSKAKSVGGGGGRKMLLFFEGNFHIVIHNVVKEKQSIIARIIHEFFFRLHTSKSEHSLNRFMHTSTVSSTSNENICFNSEWVSKWSSGWSEICFPGWINRGSTWLTINRKFMIIYQINVPKKEKKRVYLNMENISPLMPFIPSVTIMESVGWRWGWKRGWGWNLCMMFVWARSSMKKKGEKQTNRYPECVLF